MSADGSVWLTCRRRLDEPDSRLYCFPHSGGAAGEYVRWSDGLPEVEAWGLNLPGRGGRLDEEPFTDLDELVVALADQVDFVYPFVLFGHSLGALVAFEVARDLRRRGRRQPELLMASACPAPHIPRAGPDMRGLPDAEFLARIGEFHGGLPPDLLDHPDLLELVLPPVRADIAMLETYCFRPQDPLDVPLMAVGGDRDGIGKDELAEWQRHTTVPLGVRIVPGGHFYFREHPQAFLASLRECLTTIADAAR